MNLFGGAIQRKKDEKKLQEEGRLPPGQALTRIFPILHYSPVPGFDPNSWDFRVWGEIEQPLRLSWEEFQELPRSQVVMDIHCVTRWSMFDSIWEGVKVRTLIDVGIIRLKPTARYVLQHAEYGYTTNLPVEIILQDNFLLATHYNNQPITPEHGYPLRGVIGAIPNEPDIKTPYFWKGAKWLRGLEFMREDRPGFWEEAGYHNEADVWKEERVVNRLNTWTLNT